MFDEFLEINGIGPFPIYRVWMKRPIREDVRMLQMDRIARARHWLVTQLNASARMTVTERAELRVRRMIEWRSWWEKVLGRAFPMRKERNHLRWPDVPDAKWERHCHGWGCTKKVPAGRLVCPWCGRMERSDDFSWMDVLAMPRETVDMGNGICKTVFRPTGRDGGTVLEQYTRMSEEAPELKTEMVAEVPAETARAWLSWLMGRGDS